MFSKFFGRRKRSNSDTSGRSENNESLTIGGVVSVTYGCDICSSIIEGPLYFCSDCEDFMICDKCWGKKETLNHPHAFIVYSKKFRETYSPFSHHSVPKIPDPGILLLESARMFADFPCFGTFHKKYLDNESPAPTEAFLWNENQNGWRWESFKSVMDSSIHIAVGLRHLQHLEIEKSIAPRIGICLKNKPEWAKCAFGCTLANLIWIGIHPTITNQNIKHIIEISELSVFICNGKSDILEQLKEVLQELPSTSLRYIICLNKPSVIEFPHDIQLITLTEVETNGNNIVDGKENSWKPYPAGKKDPICLVFTSGSTGLPKGVIQTRNTWSLYMMRLARLNSPTTDCRMLFAPLCHSSSARHTYQSIFRGGRLGFYKESMNFLFKALYHLKPSNLTGTPRFWDFLMEDFHKDLQIALKDKDDSCSEEEIREKVIKDFKNKVGGKVKYTSVGGALASEAIKKFMEECLGTISGDGFGTTECGPVLTDGVPALGVTAKLIDIPEFGYFAKDTPSRGELCIKSETLMSGYWGDKKSTEKSFTKDGFYRTGDICEKNGEKYIVIGRLKCHFKLSSGEFLVPDFLESIYNESRFVNQIFVHGLSSFNSPVAVVVPAKSVIENTVGEYTQNIARDIILKDFHLIADTKRLMPHEQVKLVIIEEEPFSVENNLLTASGKPSRMKLIEKYLSVITSTLRAASDEWNLYIRTKISEILNIPVEEVNVGKSFSDIGGDSMAAARLSSLLEGKVSSDFIKKLLKGGSIDSAIECTYEIQDTVNILEDSKLPNSVKQKLTNKKPKTVSSDSPKIVLLTGATGFVGSFLLEYLLKDPLIHIVCLVRNEQKLQDVINQYNIQIDDSRYSCIIGDISIDKLGLSEENYFKLVKEVSFIVHCAAWVSFVMKYSELRDSNVIGTRNILELSCSGDKTIPLCYISSNSVILKSNSKVIKESEPLDSSLLEYSLDKGYAASKHVAELLIQESIQLGAPSVIFRLGTVSGHSKTGVMNPTDFLSTLFKSFFLLKAVPFQDIDSNYGFMNFIPVDYACDSIISIFQLDLNSSEFGGIYHICNPNGSMKFTEFEILFKNINSEFTTLNFTEWKEMGMNNPEIQKILHPFSILYGDTFPNLTRSYVFDTSISSSKFLLCPELFSEEWLKVYHC